MTDNPYAPPRSSVADVEIGVTLERPRSVVLGVRLMWASFAVDVLSSIPPLFFPASWVERGAHIVGTIVGLAIGFAIAYLLNTASWRGKGWARIVQLVLIFVAIPLVYFAYKVAPQTFVFPPFVVITSAVQLLLSLCGLGLLFTPTANAWYRAMKRSR